MKFITEDCRHAKIIAYTVTCFKCCNTQIQTKSLSCWMCVTVLHTHSTPPVLFSPSLFPSYQTLQEVKSSNQVMAVLHYILGMLSCYFSAKQFSAWRCDSQAQDVTLCSQTASLTCCSTWLQTSVALR